MHLQSVLFLLLLLTLTLTNVACDEKLQPQNIAVATNTQAPDKPPLINVVKPAKIEDKTAADQSSNNAAQNTVSKDGVDGTKLPQAPGPDDLLQSGALQRAFYVLLGGTLLLLLFLAFRMYRLQKGGGKPNVMVRKYGVLTNRRDVEMLPLPLDEDDEDDTVFEVGGTRIENHS